MIIKKKEWLLLKNRIETLEYWMYTQRIQEKITELEHKYHIIISDSMNKNLFQIFTYSIHKDDNKYYKLGEIIGDYSPSVIDNKYTYVVSELEKDILQFLNEKDLLTVKGGINEQKNKDLLEYALNEKPKYDEVYKYIRDNLIEPKLEPGQMGRFINQEILLTNTKELYHRAMMLETIINELAKEEGIDVSGYTRKLF